MESVLESQAYIAASLAKALGDQQTDVAALWGGNTAQYMHVLSIGFIGLVRSASDSSIPETLHLDRRKILGLPDYFDTVVSIASSLSALKAGLNKLIVSVAKTSGNAQTVTDAVSKTVEIVDLVGDGIKGCTKITFNEVFLLNSLVLFCFEHTFSISQRYTLLTLFLSSLLGTSTRSSPRPPSLRTRRRPSSRTSSPAASPTPRSSSSS